MNTPTPKADYMLLFRGTHWNEGLSLEETEKAVGEFMAWFERLRQKGTALSGRPLMNEGKTVSGKGRTVADGPFAESKEAVGGYFMLRVANMDEAVEVAKGCPALEFGMAVEVRQLADICPMMQQVNDQLAHATA